MASFLKLLKNGNKSSLLATIVNTVISIIKGVTFVFTGNVAMFAETMHSLGDAANQFFVFIGSALSRKAPTDRFPNGFGRLVNLVLLGAVLIVGIMSYETVKEGFNHVFHPTKSSGIGINLAVLGAAVLLEAYVLYKAAKEVLHEVEVEATGLTVFVKSFSSLGKATPATKLVFMEDLVATAGGVLAIFGILISHFTAFHQAEGLASIFIGAMMFFVVGRIFLENAAGALGEADEEMEDKIGGFVIADPDVRDVRGITVLKEGVDLHVELAIEIDPQLTIAQADHIKDRLEQRIMNEKGVTDVVIEFEEDDGVISWPENEDKRFL